MRMSNAPIFPSMEEACGFVRIEPPREVRRRFTSARSLEHGGRHGRDAGRVLMFPDGAGGMCFNWQNQLSAIFYFNYGCKKPNKETLRRLQAEARRQRQEYERQTAARQSAVALLAQRIVNAVDGYAVNHGYLCAKGLVGAAKPINRLRWISAQKAQRLIDEEAIPQEDGASQKIGSKGPLLVVPLTDAAGKVWSVQLIDETGKKTFLKGGLKKGLFWCPDGLSFDAGPEGVIGLAEGVATAMSVTVLYGVPCAAAMDAGNLLPAAESLLCRFPFHRLAFYADRDQNGVGMDKARDAALRLMGRGMLCAVNLPPFDSAMDAAFKRATGKLPSDFNDFLMLWDKR